jgi:hypothetical protein
MRVNNKVSVLVKSALFLAAFIAYTDLRADDDENGTKFDPAAGYDEEEDYDTQYTPGTSYLFSKNIPESNITRTIDEFGKASYPARVIEANGSVSYPDFNATNSKDSHNLFIKDRKFGEEAMGTLPQHFLNGAEGSVYQMSFEGKGGINTDDLKRRINDLDPKIDSNITRGLNLLDSFIDHIKNRAQLTAPIQCYAARQIAPSFRCSHPAFEGIGFGVDAEGNTNPTTDYKQALSVCEQSCAATEQCIAARISTASNPPPEKDAKLYDMPLLGQNETILSNADTTFRVMTYELVVSATMPDDIRKSMNDVNTSLEFVPAGVVRFDVGVFRPETYTTVRVAHLAELPLFYDRNASISIPISMNGVSEIATSFYKPDSNATVSLEKVSVNYYSNKNYYCPIVQFMPDNAADSVCTTDLQGKIEKVESDGQTWKLCRHKGNDIGEDPETGAFYTESACMEKCRVEYPCYPEYATSVAADSFSIEIGCIDPDDASNPLGNPNCSQDRCLTLLEDSNSTIDERVLVNRLGNPQVIQTVSNGVVSDSYYRPKLQLTSEPKRPGELMARNDDFNNDFTKIFALEEKDGAFASMIDRGNYTVAPLAITGRKIAAEQRKIKTEGEDFIAFDVLVKPASAEVGNGLNYYLYVVLEAEHTSLPQDMGAAYYYDAIIEETKPCDGGLGGASAQQETCVERRVERKRASGEQVEFKHRSFALFTPVGLEVYYAWYDQHFRINAIDSNQSYWMDYAPGANRQSYTKYQQATGTLINNDFSAKLTNAPKFRDDLRFGFDVPYQRISLTNNLYGLVEDAPGLLFRNQNSSQRIYSGDFDKKQRSRLMFYKLHALYSDKPLTYEKLHTEITKVVETNATNRQTDLYAIYAVGGDKLFPKTIYGDGIATDRAKLYLQGKANETTIWGEFSPLQDEAYKEGFYFLMLRPKE